MKKKGQTPKTNTNDQPQLPKGWKWVKLGEIAENIQYGYTESANTEIVGPKFLRITDIQENKVDWNTVPYCKISDNEKYKYLLRKDDLLFARTGATVGKSFLIIGDVPDSIFASYLIRVRIAAQINVNFISLFFLSPYYWEQIRENESGIGQPNVNGTKLSNLKIPIPPLSEQQRIVARIEEKFSEIDHGIEKLKLIRVQIKLYRQAVLKAAFDGKLISEVEIPAKPETLESSNKPDVTATSKKPIASLTEKEISKLPIIPTDWKWVKLGELCKGVEYGSSAKSKEKGKIPVLRMGNIQNTRFNWSSLVYTSDEAEISKYLLKKYDVLFNRTNSPELVGKTAIYLGEQPAIFAGYLIRINYLPELNPFYLTYFLNSYFAKNHGNKVKTDAVNQSNINGEKLKSYPIPLPPSLSIQNAIVSAIELRFSKADALEKVAEESLKNAERTKQSILKKAFRGELSAQLESDENVEEMLKQISQEKETSVEPKRKNPKKEKIEVIPMEEILKQKFKDKSFSFEEIQTLYEDIDYDELREKLFELLDKDNFVRSYFDEKAEAIKFKLV